MDSRELCKTDFEHNIIIKFTAMYYPSSRYKCQILEANTSELESRESSANKLGN